MFIKNSFYDHYHFPPHKSEKFINDLRKELIKNMGECTIKDLHASDLKIQINNPLMSYKGRHIGRIPGTKRSISTFDFKPTYDFLSRSAHINQMIDTPELNRVTISKKKLDRFHNMPVELEEMDDFPVLGKKPIPSVIEEIQVQEQFKKKDEKDERRKRIKKAATYLIKLGKSLKIFLKKENLHKYHSVQSDELLYNENKVIEEKKVVKSGSGEVKLYNDHSETSTIKERKSLSNNLVNIKGEEIPITKLNELSNEPKEHESKKEVKKRKKRYHTATSVTSGLTFAEKMEQLAMGKILN